jgi:hypothetical protein
MLCNVPLLADLATRRLSQRKAADAFRHRIRVLRPAQFEVHNRNATLFSTPGQPARSSVSQHRICARHRPTIFS